MRRVVLIAALIGCHGSSWQPGASCGFADEACTRHEDCCSYACIVGTCECAPRGEHCLADTGCCSGNVCEDERCVPGFSSVGDGGIIVVDAPDTCNETGEACSTNDSCCGELICRSTLGCGLCSQAQQPCNDYRDCCDQRGCRGSNGCCSMPGEGALTDSACCKTYSATRGGACCSQYPEPCTSPTECCTGLCTGGLCAKAPDGGSCADMSDCSGFPYSMCQNETCCAPQNRPCTVGTECCSGTCKPNNTCN